MEYSLGLRSELARSLSAAFQSWSSSCLNWSRVIYCFHQRLKWLPKQELGELINRPNTGFVARHGKRTYRDSNRKSSDPSFRGAHHPQRAIVMRMKRRAELAGSGVRVDGWRRVDGVR